MSENQIPWSQYDQAYKHIHDRITDLLNSNLTAVKPNKKISRYAFTWNTDGTLSALEGYDGDELLFTLSFTWNSDGTLQQISRS